MENNNLETATLGGGCFWCTEAVFDSVIGVEDVVSGYSGGHTENPTYQEVCSETTGHAEVIQIKFDPEEISYKEILEIFFGTHDPTTLNRQGNDVGSSYRSAIFYHSPEQKETAQRSYRRNYTKKTFSANRSLRKLPNLQTFIRRKIIIRIILKIIRISRIVRQSFRRKSANSDRNFAHQIENLILLNRNIFLKGRVKFISKHF